MRRSLQLTDMLFQRILGAVCVLLMIVMTVAVGGQVLMRYGFNAPLVWSEELARYSMIWLAMLACGLCARFGQHIALTDLVPFPPRVKLVVMALATIITIGLLCVLFWHSWELASRVSRQTSSSLGISMSYIYAAIPVGSLLMVVGMILGIIAEYVGIRESEPGNIETLQGAR